MNSFATLDPEARPGPAPLLQGYSVETTSKDRRSIEGAGRLLAPGAEVFVASLPNDVEDQVVAACRELHAKGLRPVPHVVARNIESRAGLERLIGRLVDEAGVDRCLVLGGDRDKPAGEYLSSLQILETGVLQRRGVGSIRIACYPEPHPKVSEAALDEARAAKLALAERDGLEVTLVSQFAFDAAPILAFAARLRRMGVAAPLRVGLAGPADRALLLKYAVVCGVGNSIRALKGRAGLAKSALKGEAPDEIFEALEAARRRDPGLGIAGIHLFTFGSLAKSVEWAEARRA